MRVQIIAVGRLRKGPEQELLKDYLDRFARTGRALSLGPAEVIELDERKHSTKPAQAQALLKALPDVGHICAMDEHGREMPSPDFAQMMARLRDQGDPMISFLIGGADGIAPEVLNKCHSKLSFGPMVWPHMLARVMLSEQLFRASSILAGLPYHRN